MKNVGLYIILLFSLSALPLFAQDSIDDLFSEADGTGGTETETGESGQEGSAEAQSGSESNSGTDADPPALDLAELTTRKEPLFKGSVSLSGGVVFGLEDWPATGTLGEIAEQAADLFDAGAFYDMSSRVSVDIRPLSYLRFFASMGTSLSTSTLKFSSPTISEIFVDYTLNDNYFFRVGRQSLAWGQGQLVANPGNLVSGLSSGVAIKAFVPLGLNGLTAVIWSNESLLAGNSTPGPDNFAWAGLFESSIRDVSYGLSGLYYPLNNQALSAALYLKTAIAGADLALEGRLDADPGDLDGGTTGLWPTTRALANLFYERGNARWFGEYYFAYGPEVETATPEAESRWAERGTHRLGLGVLAINPGPSGWKPGLRIYHDFTDSSGQIVPGLTRSIAPLLSLSLALPVTYGFEGSHYRENNEDPGKRVLALVVQLSLSRSF